LLRHVIAEAFEMVDEASSRRYGACRAVPWVRWRGLPGAGSDGWSGSGVAFRGRSTIFHVERMKAPMLLLHGAQDEHVLVRQAEAFAETLQAKRTHVTVKIFPHANHRIPIAAQNREIDPFLEAFFR
jgi:dipeptidyl aminopeptidase/acylaminoacyl peptidase